MEMNIVMDMDMDTNMNMNIDKNMNMNIKMRGPCTIVHVHGHRPRTWPSVLQSRNHKELKLLEGTGARIKFWLRLPAPVRQNQFPKS